MTDQIRAEDTALSGGLDDKGNIDHVEDGIVDDKVRSDMEEERTWPRSFQKKTMWKVDLMILPLVILLYMCASFDKSNLGNAKTLGMMKDITVDKDGKKYAFLTSLYYIGYSPFMIPCALLGKRTRLALVIACSGIYWGIASTGFAGVQNISGAYACRFLVGMGEAGFSPLIPFYLARWYTREDLGSRVGLWLSMAPLGGFLNGIIAFGVSYIKSHLESWRILFLIEGCSTLFLGIMGVIFLPDDIPTARFLTAEEKEFLLYRRRFEIANETHHINWRHALRAIYSWPVLFPVLMYSCFQISGAALLAYLPTFTSENGFTGAMAQIATLAPYGSAAVVMNIVCFASDRWRNRAWGIHIGNALTILGFGMYLGCKATMHHARFAALVFAETGHYVANPLILTWCASNSGNESKRAVAIPLTIAVAQALSIASGYLFPSTQGPKYTTGSAVCLALSIVSTAACFLYQWLIRMENNKRDAREGKPPADHRPDTNTYADKAPGFRYQP